MSKILNKLNSKYGPHQLSNKENASRDRDVAHTNDITFIKFLSHRARDRGLGFLSDKQSYYSFKRDTGQGAYKVTNKEISELKSHPRCKFSILRPPYNDLSKTW